MSDNNTTKAEYKDRRKELDTAFKQQRLRAWQPILTPRTVLPTLFLIGIIFAPLGGVLIYLSGQVSEIVIDYTNCNSVGGEFSLIKEAKYSLPSVNGDGSGSFYYKSNKDKLYGSNPNNLDTNKCTIQLDIPVDIEGPVFLYYELTNFYQNHRRYIKSISYNQLLGQALLTETELSDCAPLAVNENKIPYYPCGLIANSVFNDTIRPIQYLDDNNNKFTFSEQGIAWDSDSKKFSKTNYTPDQVLPPPNWVNRYPDGKYTDKYPPPDLSRDEHFQVWMRTAGLPTFRKLYGRTESDMKKGKYQLEIDSNFDVVQFNGKKAIVISTVSFLGGKNPYLGIAYLVVGGVCVLFGLIFTIRHIVKPRKLGDNSLLSWNRDQQ
ncbi:LEM3 family/CDC50 family protein [Neoconidiobolus thromboides FSU 785]|nr:LEM3 family/CDC50 family protein [Neoconidiobolus thromboides FSU 785]